MTTPNFGDIVETTFTQSTEQIDTRKYGFSEIRVSGSIPAVYHAGDVVHLPYTSGETSTMEAIGLAWAAYVSGVGPT